MQKSASTFGPGYFFSRPLPELLELEQKITAAAAVSFDFFDTLFVRSLLAPEDVFDIIGRRFGINNFRSMRQAAQIEAFRRMHHVGLNEITLASIYACFDQLVVQPEELMQAEYELELSLIHPNAELIELFVKTVASGKPVVLSSDMYLPIEFFTEAFQLYGLALVPMFISSARNATKRDHGELYDIVAAELGLAHERILHVGDNLDSDVKQAKAKGLTTFYYREYRCPPKLHHYTPEASLARGLLRKHNIQIRADTYQELGFLYGGPAAVGFLDWITEQAQRDKIDRILFLARDGYILDRIARLRADSQLPRFDYFLGSRVAFTLATITEANFTEFLPFLLSGSEGLSPYELLERIGVSAPANKVMEDIGLGTNTTVTHSQFLHLQKFLHAYRWEILKICRRNRRSLLAYLKMLGIQQGNRVALIDIGWNGTTQGAFESAIQNLIDIDVFGYYFCLADTPERLKCQQTRRMSALISTPSISTELVARIYDNRVGIELFFSAPHQSVIGLATSPEGCVVAVEDSRITGSGNLSQISAGIAAGMECFAYSYQKLRKKIQLPTTSLNVVMPLIEFITKAGWSTHGLLSSIKNFDNWSYTRNKDTTLDDYLN